MIIKPKIRGFICSTAHPLGCSKVVEEQYQYVLAQGHFGGPKNVLPKNILPKNILIIGSSTGYGLASRIALAFGAEANTLGIAFERPATDKRTASPGWYNTAAFEKLAQRAGLYAKTIMGDAFTYEIKQQAIDTIRNDMQPIDLVIYSLAAPRRTDPDTGTVYTSALKPIGQPYFSKTVDPMNGELKEVMLEPATAEEIAATEAVMGGDDWAMWIDCLQKEHLLAPGAITLAYSYIGPELTYPIYKEGTIGRAKQHLAKTAVELNNKLAAIGGKALISVNKALVTQASSAIPVVPLYISLLYKIMKEEGTHEGCIEQMVRLFKDRIYGSTEIKLDKEGLIRMDDYELQPETQRKITTFWQKINQENLACEADLEGYRDDFYRLFGFGVSGINYDEEVNPEVEIA